MSIFKKFSYSHTIRRDQQINRQLKNKKQQSYHQYSNHHIDDGQIQQLFIIGNKKIINKQKITNIKVKNQQKYLQKTKKIKKYVKNNLYQHSSSQITPKKQQQDSQFQKIILASQETQKLQRQIKLLTKYEKQLKPFTHPSLQQNILNQQFALKQQLNQQTLPIDIIKFGMPQIQQYGIQDGEIPFYKRNPMLDRVIGLKKKKKKMAKLMRQLNIITNQLTINQNKYQNTSQDRYFHYSGYSKILGITPQKYLIKNKQNQNHQLSTLNSQYQQQLLNNNQLVLHIQQPQPHYNPIIQPNILFSPHPQSIIYLPTNQQKLRIINKQYNIALNLNPNNIGLWLKFIDIQDKIFLLTLGTCQIEQSILSNNALIQRKISIISKALQKNILSEQLGLRYLQLLYEGKKERGFIQQNITKFLQIHPENQKLWKFFIQFKLSNIVDFRHSRLQKQFQQINKYLFQKRINQVKSGKQVWKIRNCGLILLQKILSVHRLQGYQQLCTAICCSLLQFNTFCGDEISELGKKQRMIKFKQYWQDYNIYKLGQYFCVDKDTRYKWKKLGYIENSWEGYLKKNNSGNIELINKQNQSQLSQKQGYIGKYFYKAKSSQNINYKQWWLPCHSLHDKQQIMNSPQSFILFQDIQIYLQIFRNIQNCQFLINITMTNLNMPPIFYNNPNNNTSQYLINWLSNTILYPNSESIPSPFHQCNIWGRYWHPKFSYEFLGVKGENDEEGNQQINKFIYCVNVVQCLYLKFGEVKQGQNQDVSNVREYLMFIYGIINYLHSNYNKKRVSKYHKNQSLKHLLSVFPQSLCESRIQQLLMQQPNNINLWVMYIEFQCYKGVPIQQCINCYISYISTINSNNHTNQEIYEENSKLVGVLDKLGGLYWMSQFIYRYGYKKKDDSNKIYQNNQSMQQQFNSRMVILTILKFILLQQFQSQQNQQKQSPQPSLQQYINTNIHKLGLTQIQKLLIGNKLKQLLKFLGNRKLFSTFPTSLLYHVQQYHCIIYYMLLQLGQSPSTLIPLLYNTHVMTNGSIQMGINILVDYGLLDYPHIKQGNILTNGRTAGNLKVIGYLSRKVLGDYSGRLCEIFWNEFREWGWMIRKYNRDKNENGGGKKNSGKDGDDYYQENSQNRLYLWMVIMRILQPEHRPPFNQEGMFSQYYANYKYFISYFLSIAQKHLIDIHEPVCMQLLNKLLLNPQFSYSCLNQFPYCRKLYEIARLSKSNKEKIQRLILDKEIRINVSG